jgi:hypothetical protein
MRDSEYDITATNLSLTTDVVDGHQLLLPVLVDEDGF